MAGEDVKVRQYLQNLHLMRQISISFAGTSEYLDLLEFANLLFCRQQSSI